MKQRIVTLYFSPTGTTKKIVSTIAEGIITDSNGWAAGDVLDCTLPAIRTHPVSFTKGDLVIVGVPVYAGRVPNILLPFLNSIEGNGASAVAVVSYGNRDYDDALIELADILEEHGFRVLAAGAFIGEHSFSRTLGADRPDAGDLAVAGAFARSIIALANEKDTVLPPLIRGTRPYRKHYVPRGESGEPAADFRKIKPSTDETCIHCGVCAAVCPMASIDPSDFSAITGICIKCCACVKNCPTSAKRFDNPDFIAHKLELERAYDRRQEPELFIPFQNNRLP